MENDTKIAFDKQSAVFDELYQNNAIINYKRKRVRGHLLQFLNAKSNILELNSGTGEDAIFFAEQGFKVHATDISTGMQRKLQSKVSLLNLQNKVSNEVCSFTALESLQNKGPYDCIFSNFAGLNCTGELDKVLKSFSPLLNSKGVVTLVLLPKFCLWETLLLFKGKFNTAFRRFFSTNKQNAHLEGVYFNCWYYNPSFVEKCLAEEFDTLSIEGLCTLVPPSYLEGFAEKHPKLYDRLIELENRFKGSWPWRVIGDYYIITLRKK